MAYIYDVDVWCRDCGDAIKAHIREHEPERVPKDELDEGSFDSGDWPKAYDPESEEADSPTNCGSETCGGTYWVTVAGVEKALSYGKFLENRLTQAGYKNLKAMLDEYTDSNIPPYAKEWAEFYQFTYWTNPWSSAQEWLIDKIKDLGIGAEVQLVGIAIQCAQSLDSDTIQDLFQSDMEDDDFFKDTGWYSPEMET